MNVEERIANWEQNKILLRNQIVPCTSGIYMIISPSGKKYIGQSIDIQDRLGSYRRLDCHKQRKIYNSLRKYGFTNHIVYYLPLNQELLDEYEILFIAFFNTMGQKGLNCVPGGKNSHIPRHTVKTPSKRRAVNNERYSIWQRGRTLPQQHKDNISFGLRTSIKYQMMMRERDRQGPANGFYGKRHTQEVRERLSQLRKGKMLNGKNPSAKLVWNTVTGEIFQCAKELVPITGLSYDALRQHLMGRRKKSFDYRYLEEKR